MDTTAGRRRRTHLTIQRTDADSEYNHDVNMYKKSPSNVISLKEFEELSLERLQLLRIIEEASVKGNKQFSEDWKKYIRDQLVKLGLRKYLRLMSGHCGQTEQDIQARRADYLSHFILRIAYCRSEDLRRWFLAREMEWFKLRFLALSPQGITNFLQINNLTYTPIPIDVKDKLRHDLVVSTAGINENSFNPTDFYKVPFIEVLYLVRHRRVLVENGYAYVPTSDLVVSILAKFRASLNESLVGCNQRLPNLDDDRLNNLLNNLHNMYTGKSYVVEDNKDGINPANLDAYAKQHFPLCMRTLYTILKTSHHLKHQARLQLILFLKAIGLSYEDTMQFWRSEFTKNPQIDENKFEKDYSYNVRHSFGKVGSMTSYSPFSCIKIIMGSVGPGEFHGCPFKHWDASILKQKLGEYGIPSSSVNSVVETATGGHYQIACSKYFECTRGQAPPNMISHPNQYFTESLNLANEKEDLKKKN